MTDPRDPLEPPELNLRYSRPPAPEWPPPVDHRPPAVPAGPDAYDGFDDDGFDDDGGFGDGGFDDDEPDTPGLAARLLDRRRFLQVFVAGGAAAAGAGVIYSGRERVIGAEPPPVVAEPSTQIGVVTRANESPDPAGRLLEGAIDNRVLVVIELEGGNDGPSTVVPYGSGAYYDLRPTVAIAEEEVLDLDGQVGLHPNLARLHRRGIAVVEGVGPIDGNLSHFEMVQRWSRGDMDGTADLRSGFLARLAGTVDNGSPLVGLSVGGTTTRFANSTASTLALNNPDALGYLDAGDGTDPVRRTYQVGLSTFATDETTMAGVVGSSWRQLLDLGATINESTMRENDESNPMFTDGGRLGRQLALAADLIAADVGVRVIHAHIGGFDTHENHRGRHDGLMAQVDAAIDGFLAQVELDGAADRVIVATTSEFGRRLAENDGRGVDHGSASVMLVAGAPVVTGRHGIPSAIDDPDGRGNLQTQVPFDGYLGTLAQRWLGIEAASVLPGRPELIDGLF